MVMLRSADVEPRPQAGALAPSARFVLGAARAWFAAGGPAPSLCLAFACAGLSSAAVARFAAALGLIATASRRAVDMRAPGASGLSRDEGLLLIALAALQGGEPWRAQRAVAEWLPAPLALRGIAALAALAESLACSGLRLPREPVEEAALPAAWQPPRPPVLH
jgi:hypothetical protein